MIWIALALALAGAFLCMKNWRFGVPIALLGGLLADPVRKIVPGEPVALVLTPLVLLGLSFLASVMTEGPVRVWAVSLLRELRPALLMALAWLLCSAALSLVRYQNPIMTAIGLLSYTAPLPALLLAYRFGLNPARVRHALLVYLTACTTMQLGGYFAFLGFEWPLLRQVGEGMVISSQGLTLEAYTGFFRTPEIAAWHAATAICLVIVLVTANWVRLPSVALGLLVLYLLIAGMITGRRKMLAEVALFLAVYSWLLMRRGGGVGRLLTVIVLTTGIVGFALVAWTAATPQLHPYLIRGFTVFGDAPTRISDLGISAIVDSVRRFGFLGAGLGVASQGAQHFGSDAVPTYGVAEGGVGKITTELGVPGLLIAVWVGLLCVRYAKRMILRLESAPPQVRRFAYGVIALLIANISTYLVAAQVFGDPFVLLLLGLMVGISLALQDRHGAPAIPTKTRRGRRRPVAIARPPRRALPVHGVVPR